MEEDSDVGRKPTIVIVGARGLRNADWSFSGANKSDPYTICRIVGKNDFQIRTRTIDDALDPVWNHKEVMKNWEPGDDLIFQVFDKDFGKRDESLGTFTLLSSEFDRHGFDGDLRLRETGGPARSYLKVRIFFGEHDWNDDDIQNAAMATATFTKSGMTSVMHRMRNKRLGIDNVNSGVTRRQFRDFLRNERDRQIHCATLPFTILIWVTFSMLAWVQGNVSTVHRLRRGILNTIQGIHVPHVMPDGTRGPDLMLGNVSSIDHMWEWIGRGLVPKFGAHANTSHAGFVNGFNKLLGQVQLRQRRSPLGLCHGAEAVEGSLAGFAQLGCRNTGDASQLAAYGPAVGVAGDATADPSFVLGGALPIGAAERAFSLDDYYYAFLDVLQPSIAVERVGYLRNNTWCDDATMYVEVQAAFFNGEVMAFTHASVRFDFQPGGVVRTAVSVRPVVLPEWTNAMIGLSSFWVLLLLLLCLKAVQDVIDRKDKGSFRRRLCGDPWVVLDIAGFVAGIALVIGFVLLSQALDLFLERLPELRELYISTPPLPGASSPTVEAYREKVRGYELVLSVSMQALGMAVEFKAMHRIGMLLYTFFVLLRFFRGFLGQPVMASIARTLQYACQDLLHFAFMLLITFENFTLGGLLLFGSQVEAWSSVHAAHISALMMLAGLGDFAPLYDVYPASAMVWLFLFAVALVFIGANMLLAILTGHYSEVRGESALSGQSIFDQAYVLAGDTLWVSTYHLRRLALVLRAKVPKLCAVLPYFDPEEPRNRKIPYDEILEALQPPSHEDESAVASGRVTRHSKFLGVPWAKGIPDWAPMHQDFLTSIGCDEATSKRLMTKAAAFQIDPEQLPADMLSKEFEGQMRNMYEQLYAMDEDLKMWLGDRSIDCQNMQPRQRTLETLAAKSIVTRTAPDAMLSLPGSPMPPQPQLEAPPEATMAPLEPNTPGAQAPRSFGPPMGEGR